MATTARIAETHSAFVVFVGDLVYKMKKPVRLGFLDFTTREARERACRREVELNRRLAPDVYLGVWDVRSASGETIDHMVVMRAMDDTARLSTLIERGEDVTDALREIARIVAAFHARAQTSPEIARAGSRDAMLAHWNDSIDAIAPFVGGAIPAADFDRVARLARAYLAGREPLFAERMRAGRVRDGHGDLLADDIFLEPDGPRILDCIEFNDAYRWVDGLNDSAFLAMDVERLGRPDLAARFIGWYREYSGDTFPPSLADHYVAYRAHVRAKVACIRALQGDENARTHARLHHDLALAHLEQARVRMVLVGGIPGTGKSTIARAVADARDLELIRSDVVRKELAGLDHATHVRTGFNEGMYAEPMTRHTYHEMLSRARASLERGFGVVLDATWNDERLRAQARSIADATATEFVEVVCDAAEPVRARRLAERDPSDPSDATPEIAEMIAARTDPWPSAVTIDTSGSKDAAIRESLEVLDQQRAGSDLRR
jgi:hypothetical protein